MENLNACRRCGKPAEGEFCSDCYKDFCNFLDGKGYAEGYEQGQKDLYDKIVNMIQARYPEAYWRFKNYDRTASN